ncbi:MAG: DUF421 domain-containing protein [Chloroflexi bacterium]|nr:MAG: DUF421 domain-containing protein [Chloroflexota bacterium]
MGDLWRGIEQALGLDAEALNVGQMALRTLIIYFVALFMVRVGEKRFLGKSTAFDVIIGVMLGSLVSRAITNVDQFIPIIVSGFLMVALHWLLAAIAFRSDWIAALIKGDHRVLVRDGEIQWDAMRKSHIGENDLMSALRLEARVTDLAEVKEARLERSGEISVIRTNQQDD